MIIIPGEPEEKPRSNSLLSARWFAREAESVLRSTRQFEMMRRLNALRESCGVKGPQGTVSVRVPWQYRTED